MPSHTHLHDGNGSGRGPGGGADHAHDLVPVDDRPGAHEHHDQAHPHDHGRPGVHDHDHVNESYAVRPHPEFVVLDLGDGIGALIVHADPALHGVEVEISPTGHDERRQHKEVLERRAGDRAAFTAVFDALDAGSYTLWVDDIARARDVPIDGGAIAELDWTGNGSDPAAAA